jgi:Low psii accumulation1 / Rep27
VVCESSTMLYLRRYILVWTTLSVCVGAFSPSNRSVSNKNPALTTTEFEQNDSTRMILFSEPETKNKGGLESGMRGKLVTESIAPWRTLRLFLYGSLGSGAFIGGLINTSGAIAGSNRPEFNLNTEVGTSRDIQ